MMYNQFIGNTNHPIEVFDLLLIDLLPWQKSVLSLFCFIFILYQTVTCITRYCLFFCIYIRRRYSMSSSEAILKTLEVTMYRCDLREKQRTVLWMLLQGKEKKEIANTLHLSEEAIRKHQRTIYNKLGIEGKSQLVKWVIEQIS
ncbi:LuxR family transcriptional regulator, partial [Paenibacillus tundrae]|nr:LuxR family transcriptional regulator [Paenibacillus tundrae]